MPHNKSFPFYPKPDSVPKLPFPFCPRSSSQNHPNNPHVTPQISPLPQFLSPNAPPLSGDQLGLGYGFWMCGDERVKLLCSFGGEFVWAQGRSFYLGGKTRLVSIDRSSSFRSLLAKMSEVCDADPSSVDVKFQLPDGSLDSRLISVETDDDVRNMIEEFDPSRKIPIFLFNDRARISDEDEDEDVDNDLEGIANEVDDDEGLRVLDSVAIDLARETAMLGAEETNGSPSGPSTSVTSFRRDYERSQVVLPSVSGEMFRRDHQSLVVGQEYDDVQTFRNALTSAAIAGNFELHMIRSDQRRVTARCAAEGCTWRVHASKLPQVNSFRVRTLTPEHNCERSGDGGHRQATAKWIANCIREKLGQNRNYKPREILNDIHREYGVLITYKRAFLGREKALEELRTEPKRDMGPIEHNYQSMSENSTEAWGEIHDPPRRKRVCRPSDPKEVRPVHCTRCNQIGHNRRTCTVLELLEDGSS